MRYVLGLLLVATVQTACVKTPAPKPELDPVKVQEAIYNLGAHVIAIEKKLGIEDPKVEEPKK